jgi:beta-phosphoglucomutase
MNRTEAAVIFDLDGVLTDTAELHYQSWKQLADQEGLPFDRAANEALRGLSREDSLARLLGGRAGDYPESRRRELAERKNQDYLARVARLHPGDLMPGAERLLGELARRGARLAVASSSRNARTVIERLGIGGYLQAIVDGIDAPRSKPDPQVFVLAAERLAVAAQCCVVVEDAESGVAAALAAGMKVAGIGPRQRVAGAHLLVDTIAALTAESVLRLADGECPLAAGARVAPPRTAGGR